MKILEKEHYRKKTSQGVQKLRKIHFPHQSVTIQIYHQERVNLKKIIED